MKGGGEGAQEKESRFRPREKEEKKALPFPSLSSPVSTTLCSRFSKVDTEERFFARRKLLLLASSRFVLLFYLSRENREPRFARKGFRCIYVCNKREKGKKGRIEFTETFLPVAGLRVSLGANAAPVRALAVGDGAILVVGTQISQQSGDHADRCRGRSVRGCHSLEIELSDESMSTNCRCFSRGGEKKKKREKKENIPRTNDIDPITDVERIRS